MNRRDFLKGITGTACSAFFMGCAAPFREEGKKQPPNVVFIIAGLTDILDGYLARKYHLATAFGRVARSAHSKMGTSSILIYRHAS